MAVVNVFPKYRSIADVSMQKRRQVCSAKRIKMPLKFAPSCFSNTSRLHVVVYQVKGMVDGARARTQNMIECNS